jgi:hypothetical protein
MWRTNRRHSIAFLIWFIAVSASICTSFVGCQQQPNENSQPQSSTAPPQEMSKELEQQLMVEPGNEPDAFIYYRETFDELGLNPRGLSGQPLVDSQNLSLSLEFLGYKGLKPGDVEDLPSDDLMKRFPENVLASAFFAPKITDVSQTPLNIGWRKVVRFKAQAGSDAEKKGIASGFLLFNKFQGKDKYSTDPLKPRPDKTNESKTTQLILTRADSSTLMRPVYFLVYGPISQGGKLITFLTASFDARDPSIVPEGKYYVPQACAECHGGKIIDPNQDWKKIKVNYLDTDHWFDRLNDDFAVLKNAPFGVLYDGGKDETTPKFEAAFNVLRRLNNEIKTQNERVEPTPGDPSFQLRAVRKWVELHQTNSRHQDYFARALPSTAGEPWKADGVPDGELLPLMNQYCFRCHSSLKFNIFDRPAVKSRKSRIVSFLDKPVTQKFHMPQDRVLDEAVKEKIKKLVNSFEP